MKLMEFKYNDKPRKLVVMNNSEQYVEGLDIATATEAEAEEIKKIFLETEEKLKPYLRFYRKFFRKDILD